MYPYHIKMLLIVVLSPVIYPLRGRKHAQTCNTSRQPVVNLSAFSGKQVDCINSFLVLSTGCMARENANVISAK